MITNLLVQVVIIALGPLQFGLHMSELNAPLPYMPCSKSSDCIRDIGDGASASSAYAIGGLVGSLLAHKLAARFGRKGSLVILSLGFLVGSLVASFARQNAQLVVGRVVSGVAAGASIVVAPLFITEISPPKYRGRLGASSQISVNTGILLTQLLGVVWAKQHWRRIIAAGIVCSLVQLVALAYAVESPKWLLENGRAHDASVASSWLGRDFDTVRTEEAPRDPDGPQTTVYEYLTQPKYRYSLVMAASVMGIQQFSGINAIIFYGVSILQNAIPNHSELINLGLSLLNLVVTISSAGLIDAWGRRKLLVLSLGGMAVGTSMLACTLGSHHAMASAVAAMVVIVTFAMGLGPIPFLLIGELTPPDALGVAQSVGTTFNWIATFIIGAFFPWAESTLGSNVWFVFSATCVVGAVVLGRALTH